MRRQDVQKLLAQVWQLIEVYRNRPGDIGFVSRALAIALALNVGGGMSHWGR